MNNGIHMKMTHYLVPLVALYKASSCCRVPVAFGMQSSKSFFSYFGVFGGLSCRFGGMSRISVQEPSKTLNQRPLVRLTVNVNKILINHRITLLRFSGELS